MTKEKELLLQDLSARLPYGVKVKVTPVPSEEYNHIFFNAKIVDIDIDYIGVLSDNGLVLQQDIIKLKPYLFPLSSMTEEQKIECFKGKPLEIDKYGDIAVKDDFYGGCQYTDLEIYLEVIDWLNKNHFDYRGLIPMGLAIDATDKNIY